MNAVLGGWSISAITNYFSGTPLGPFTAPTPLSGGWNGGNPMVYGVPGEPNVDMTCLALMALLWTPAATDERETSVEWLKARLKNTRGKKSLAMAQFCLAVHGERSEVSVVNASGDQQDATDTLSSAWTIMASTAHPGWLP